MKFTLLHQSRLSLNQATINNFFLIQIVILFSISFFSTQAYSGKKIITPPDAHSLAVKTDGTLWAWGLGSGPDGGSYHYSNIPVQIGTDTDWKTVSARRAYSVGIKTDGTLWEWIRGAYTNPPVQVGTDTDWKTVLKRKTHSIATKTDKTLWAWGGNRNGQLGDGSNTSSNIPIYIMSEVSIADNTVEVYTTGAIHIMKQETNNDRALFRIKGVKDIHTEIKYSQFNMKFKFGTENEYPIYDFSSENGDASIVSANKIFFQDISQEIELTCKFDTEECLIRIANTEFDENALDTLLTENMTVTLEINGTDYINTGKWNQQDADKKTLYKKKL